MTYWCLFNNLTANSLSVIATFSFFEKKPTIEFCFIKNK